MVPLPAPALRRLALALPLLLPLTACGGGGGGSSSSGSGGGGGGGGGGAFVSFQTSGLSVVENDEVVGIVLNLSEQQVNPVEVEFTTAGDAQHLGDWFLITQSPVVIPQFQNQGLIEVQLLDDFKGELDEVVKFTLTGGDLAIGSPKNHVLTLVDDDRTTIFESEPNDEIANADVAGGIGPTVGYDLIGFVAADGTDDFDVYQLAVSADGTLDCRLRTGNALADVALVVTDPNGNPLATWDSAGPGGAEGGQLATLLGEVLYVWVSTTDALADYEVVVVGLEFVP